MTTKASEALVLAVDDEIGILKLIRLELMAQGFRVITAFSGEDAIKLADEHRPDIVLLDIRMPDMNGMEVMKALRERSNIPIILVTAKDKEEDIVSGLELGADDYVVKPFGPDELAARIRAVLRRSESSLAPKGVVTTGNIDIDLDKRLVKRDNEIISLTRNEWPLLQQLAINAGRVMLNAELLSKVWGPEFRDDVQYLQVWISRLRHKLEEDPSEPKIIKTARGIGYMMSAEELITEASSITKARENGVCTVLAVDDDEGILSIINVVLTAQRFRVFTASSAEEAINLAAEHRPDIVLLEKSLPDMSGFEVMKRLREDSNVPIIFVTGRNKEIDRVSGLELGADDYVVKPFMPNELVARIRAVLRRGETAYISNNIIHIGNIEVDLDKRLVKRDNEIVSLTRTEWLLLRQLAVNSGKVMINAEILSKVWGPEYRDDTQYLRNWISILRHKLEEDPADPKIIKTAQGIGYMMSAGT